MILPSSTTNFSDFIAAMRVDFNTGVEIPYPVDVQNWRSVCNKIANSPLFVRLGVAPTDTFSNWWDWGKMLYNTAAR